MHTYNINKLANDAFQQGSASKAKMKQLLNDLIQENSESVEHLMNFSESGRELLIKLYNFTQPAIPKKPKELLHVLQRVLPKNDVRYFLNYIYVTEDTISVADGHRLVSTANSKHLDPGFYDKNMLKIENPDFAKYPPVDDLILSVKAKNKLTSTVDSEDLIIHDDGGYNYTGIRLESGEIVWLNTEYLNKMLGDFKEVTISVSDTLSAVIVHLPDFPEVTYVAMPVRQPIGYKDPELPAEEAA